MAQALVGLDVSEMQGVLGAGHPAFRARQLYQAIYQQKVEQLDEITTLPVALRAQLRDQVTVGLPKANSWFDSSDGTRRYLLELEDGRTVETVLMPEEGRDTICISSQVGCPVDCQFCLTAKMGIERNLTAGEIIGQILLVAGRHGLSPTDSRLNVVMMGMGEPLLNLANVLRRRELCSIRRPLGCRPEG